MLMRGHLLKVVYALLQRPRFWLCDSRRNQASQEGGGRPVADKMAGGNSCKAAGHSRRRGGRGGRQRGGRVAAALLIVIRGAGGVGGVEVFGPGLQVTRGLGTAGKVGKLSSRTRNRLAVCLHASWPWRTVQMDAQAKCAKAAPIKHPETHRLAGLVVLAHQRAAHSGAAAQRQVGIVGVRLRECVKAEEFRKRSIEGGASTKAAVRVTTRTVDLFTAPGTPALAQ